MSEAFDLTRFKSAMNSASETPAIHSSEELIDFDEDEDTFGSYPAPQYQEQLPKIDEDVTMSEAVKDSESGDKTKEASSKKDAVSEEKPQTDALTGKQPKLFDDDLEREEVRSRECKDDYQMDVGELRHRLSLVDKAKKQDWREPASTLKASELAGKGELSDEPN